MRKVLSIIFIFVISISTLILQSCSKTNKEDVVEVGAILPLTGNISFLGVPQKNAIELAVEKFNKQYDKKVKIIWGDSKGKSTDAVSIVNKMFVANKIKYYIAFLTGVNESIKPIIEKNDALLFALSFYPPLVHDTENVLRIFYNADEEAFLLSNYVKKQNYEDVRISIIRSTDAVTEYETREFLIPRLKSFTGFVYDIPFNVGQKDLKAEVQKAKNNNPDYIVILGFGSDFPNILKEILINFKNIPNIIGGIGFLEAKDKIKHDNIMENVKFVVPSFMLSSKNDEYLTLSSTYKQRFNSVLTYDGIYAHENIKILIKTLNSISSSATPEEVREAIILKKYFPGIAGEIEIQENGDSKSPLILVEMKNDNLIRVE